MGPRFFKRGEESARESNPLDWVELQWGHAFSSVERGVSVEAAKRCKKLQWGHAFSSVERGRRAGGRVGILRFNGATLFQAWRGRIAEERRGPSQMLQWGHAFSSVER